jgi:hypothetical protein
MRPRMSEQAVSDAAEALGCEVAAVKADEISAAAALCFPFVSRQK